MDMKDVKSSQIAAIGYDRHTSTLAVSFHNGGTYHYHAVPEHRYLEMLHAKSKGSFLATHIKGMHRFTKLEPAPRGPRHS